MADIFTSFQVQQIFTRVLLTSSLLLLFSVSLFWIFPFERSHKRGCPVLLRLRCQQRRRIPDEDRSGSGVEDAPTSRTRTYPFFSPEWGLGLSLSPGCPVSMAKMVLSKVRLKEKAPSLYPRLLAISKTLDGSSSISTLQGHS